MSASPLTLTRRTYTPIAFRPVLERWVAGGLVALACVLWLFVIPLELALGLRVA
jgi:hypothetical protein